MKKVSLFLLFLVSALQVAHAVELIRFDSNPNNFNAWTYTRESVELTKENITGDKINLYKEGTRDYTLVSPMFRRGSSGYLVISFKGKSLLYNNSNYNPYKGSPTIEILDNEGNVLKSCFHEFENKVRQRNFTVRIDVSDVELAMVKLRIACWNANIYSALSVNEVVVDDIVIGDVNGDGSVTSTDVTVLYNWLINNDNTYMVNGDVNSDGSINAGDITFVYNMLLGI